MLRLIILCLSQYLSDGRNKSKTPSASLEILLRRFIGKIKSSRKAGDYNIGTKTDLKWWLDAFTRRKWKKKSGPIKDVTKVENAWLMCLNGFTRLRVTRDGNKTVMAWLLCMQRRTNFKTIEIVSDEKINSFCTLVRGRYSTWWKMPGEPREKDNSRRREGQFKAKKMSENRNYVKFVFQQESHVPVELERQQTRERMVSQRKKRGTCTQISCGSKSKNRWKSSATKRTRFNSMGDVNKIRMIRGMYRNRRTKFKEMGGVNKTEGALSAETSGREVNQIQAIMRHKKDCVRMEALCDEESKKWKNTSDSFCNWSYKNVQRTVPRRWAFIRTLIWRRKNWQGMQSLRCASFWWKKNWTAAHAKLIL